MPNAVGLWIAAVGSEGIQGNAVFSLSQTLRMLAIEGIVGEGRAAR